jgi:hypothetical protein
MSIIYDALRKVDKKNKNNNKRNKKSRNKPVKSRRLLAIILSSIFCILLFTSLIFYFKASNYRSPKFLAKSSVTKSTDKNNQQLQRKPLPPKQYKKGQYLLEGIINDQKVPLAVINGEVLSVGDKIGAIKILEINDKSVKIFDSRKQAESYLNFE